MVLMMENGVLAALVKVVDPECVEERVAAIR